MKTTIPYLSNSLHSLLEFHLMCKDFPPTTIRRCFVSRALITYIVTVVVYVHLLSSCSSRLIKIVVYGCFFFTIRRMLVWCIYRGFDGHLLKVRVEGRPVSISFRCNKVYQQNWLLTREVYQLSPQPLWFWLLTQQRVKKELLINIEHHILNRHRAS